MKKIVMKKIVMKKILNKNLLFIVMGLFLAMPVLAADLVVDFEQTPLFNNANFLPGDAITRQVKVTNNASEAKSIVVEAINFSGFPDPNNISADDLSRALNIVIKESSGSELYSDTLFNFYDKGETYLSDIDPSNYKDYDFQISFPKGLGDEWQSKTTNFDILVGFQGEGGNTEPIEEGGGGEGSTGGGGGIVRGLIIKEPLSVIPDMESAVIQWTTNYASTSQVVYAAEGEGYSFDLNALNYGYPHSTTEDLNKVVNHSVTLIGLIPGVTYYYRCISHGSFALSTEYSFTTLAGENPSNPGEEPNEESEEASSREVRSNKLVTSTIGAKGDDEGEANEEEEESFIPEDPEIQESKKFNNGFLASMAGWFENQNLCWLLILLIAVLIILFFLCIKKGKKEKKKIYWLLPLATIGLFILYCLYCPYYWLVGIAILVISLIIYLAIMLKA